MNLAMAMRTAQAGRGIGFAALGLTVVLSGCAAPRSTDDAAPQRFVESPTVAENARQKFGDRAEKAYRELAQFSIDQWLKAPLVDPGAPTPTASALSDGIVEHLDPATLPHWQNSVTAALQANADEANTVRMLRFFNLQAPTLRMPDGGKSPITGEGVTEGTVGLGEVRPDGIYPLVVSFRQRARLNLMSGRSPSAVNLRKQVTFTVVPLEELVKASPGATAVTITAVAGTAPASSGASTGAPPEVSTSATTTMAPALASTATPMVITRSPTVKWLITTFQGDITTTDSTGVTDDDSSSPPSSGATSTTKPASPAPTTSRVLAR